LNLLERQYRDEWSDGWTWTRHGQRDDSRFDFHHDTIQDLHVGFSAEKRIIYVKTEEPFPKRVTFTNVTYPWLLLFAILWSIKTIVPIVRGLESNLSYDLSEQYD